MLAPTGTISFMMDCDTTGVEPDFSLVKSKKLVGGGEITIVNKTVPLGLEKLGYAPNEVDEVVAYIDERNTIVGAPYVKTEHYPVFDCAIGERAVHYTGHVKMMGAIQPFISGAISKTVNLPEAGDDRRRRPGLRRRVEARREGDRDLPRQLQGRPAAVGQGRQGPGHARPAARSSKPQRHRLPDDRTEVGRKFRVGEYEGYIHVGIYDDGTPGRHLRRHRQGGHDPRRPDELVHDLRLARPAVRRPAEFLAERAETIFAVIHAAAAFAHAAERLRLLREMRQAAVHGHAARDRAAQYAVPMRGVVAEPVQGERAGRSFT